MLTTLSHTAALAMMIAAGMTAAATDYAKGRTGKRLFAIKGGQGFALPIINTPQRKQSGKDRRKVDLFVLGVDQAKLVVVRRWNNSTPGPGYCHFPDERPDDWFKQITAEKLVTRYVKGHPVREWKIPEKARNEGLDCRVYAYAALKIMAPRLQMIARKLGIDTSNAVPERRKKLQHVPKLPQGVPHTAASIPETPKSAPVTPKVAPDRPRAGDAIPHNDKSDETPQNATVVRSRQAARVNAKRESRRQRR